MEKSESDTELTSKEKCYISNRSGSGIYAISPTRVLKSDTISDDLTDRFWDVSFGIGEELEYYNSTKYIKEFQWADKFIGLLKKYNKVNNEVEEKIDYTYKDSRKEV